ncbi:MAG: hypothetical protein R3E66_09630 [bacterium]
MKRFGKKIALALVVVGFGVGAAGVALAKGNPEQRMERLAEKLELTAPQKAKIGEIFKARRAQAEKIKADDSLNGDQKKAKLRELRQAGKGEVAAVLTPAQKQKFQEMRAERKGRKGEKGHEGRHGKRGEKMAKELGLNDAQKAKFKSIMSDAKEERAAILEANNGDREAARPELKAHREKTKLKMRAVLTAAQQKKFDAMKEKRGDKRDKERGPRDI